MCNSPSYRVVDPTMNLISETHCSYERRTRPTLGIIRPRAVEKKWGPSLKKKKNHGKITLHTICATKLQIKLLYSIFSNKTYSIDNMANPINLSCDI